MMMDGNSLRYGAAARSGGLNPSTASRSGSDAEGVACTLAHGAGEGEGERGSREMWTDIRGSVSQQQHRDSAGVCTPRNPYQEDPFRKQQVLLSPYSDPHMMVPFNHHTGGNVSKTHQKEGGEEEARPFASEFSANWGVRTERREDLIQTGFVLAGGECGSNMPSSSSLLPYPYYSVFPTASLSTINGQAGAGGALPVPRGGGGGGYERDRDAQGGTQKPKAGDAPPWVRRERSECVDRRRRPSAELDDEDESYRRREREGGERGSVNRRDGLSSHEVDECRKRHRSVEDRGPGSIGPWDPRERRMVLEKKHDSRACPSQGEPKFYGQRRHPDGADSGRQSRRAHEDYKGTSYGHPDSRDSAGPDARRHEEKSFAFFSRSSVYDGGGRSPRREQEREEGGGGREREEERARRLSVGDHSRGPMMMRRRLGGYDAKEGRDGEGDRDPSSRFFAYNPPSPRGAYSIDHDPRRGGGGGGGERTRGSTASSSPSSLYSSSQQPERWPSSAAMVPSDRRGAPGDEDQERQPSSASRVLPYQEASSARQNVSLNSRPRDCVRVVSIHYKARSDGLDTASQSSTNTTSAGLSAAGSSCSSSLFPLVGGRSEASSDRGDGDVPKPSSSSYRVNYHHREPGGLGGLRGDGGGDFGDGLRRGGRTREVDCAADGGDDSERTRRGRCFSSSRSPGGQLPPSSYPSPSSGEGYERRQSRHPRCSPCIFFAAGICRNGENCRKCHFEEHRNPDSPLYSPVYVHREGLCLPCADHRRHGACPNLDADHRTTLCHHPDHHVLEKQRSLYPQPPHQSRLGQRSDASHHSSRVSAPSEVKVSSSSSRPSFANTPASRRDEGRPGSSSSASTSSFKKPRENLPLLDQRDIRVARLAAGGGAAAVLAGTTQTLLSSSSSPQRPLPPWALSSGRRGRKEEDEEGQRKTREGRKSLVPSPSSIPHSLHLPLVSAATPLSPPHSSIYVSTAFPPQTLQDAMATSLLVDPSRADVAAASLPVPTAASDPRTASSSSSGTTTALTAPLSIATPIVSSSASSSSSPAAAIQFYVAASHPPTCSSPSRSTALDTPPSLYYSAAPALAASSPGTPGSAAPGAYYSLVFPASTSSSSSSSSSSVPRHEEKKEGGRGDRSEGSELGSRRRANESTEQTSIDSVLPSLSKVCRQGRCTPCVDFYTTGRCRQNDCTRCHELCHGDRSSFLYFQDVLHRTRRCKPCEAFFLDCSCEHEESSLSPAALSQLACAGGGRLWKEGTKEDEQENGREKRIKTDMMKNDRGGLGLTEEEKKKREGVTLDGSSSREQERDGCRTLCCRYCHRVEHLAGFPSSRRRAEECRCPPQGDFSFQPVLMDMEYYKTHCTRASSGSSHPHQQHAVSANGKSSASSTKVKKADQSATDKYGRNCRVRRTSLGEEADEDDEGREGGCGGKNIRLCREGLGGGYSPCGPRLSSSSAGRRDADCRDSRTASVRASEENRRSSLGWQDEEEEEEGAEEEEGWRGRGEEDPYASYKDDALRNRTPKNETSSFASAGVVSPSSSPPISSSASASSLPLVVESAVPYPKKRGLRAEDGQITKNSASSHLLLRHQSSSAGSSRPCLYENEQETSPAARKVHPETCEPCARYFCHIDGCSIGRDCHFCHHEDHRDPDSPLHPSKLLHALGKCIPCRFMMKTGYCANADPYREGGGVGEARASDQLDSSSAGKPSGGGRRHFDVLCGFCHHIDHREFSAKNGGVGEDNKCKQRELTVSRGHAEDEGGGREHEGKTRRCSSSDDRKLSEGTKGSLVHIKKEEEEAKTGVAAAEESRGRMSDGEPEEEGMERRHRDGDGRDHVVGGNSTERDNANEEKKGRRRRLRFFKQRGSFDPGAHDRGVCTPCAYYFVGEDGCLAGRGMCRFCHHADHANPHSAAHPSKLLHFKGVCTPCSAFKKGTCKRTSETCIFCHHEDHLPDPSVLPCHSPGVGTPASQQRQNNKNSPPSSSSLSSSARQSANDGDEEKTKKEPTKRKREEEEDKDEKEREAKVLVSVVKKEGGEDEQQQEEEEDTQERRREEERAASVDVHGGDDDDNEGNEQEEGEVREREVTTENKRDTPHVAQTRAGEKAKQELSLEKKNGDQHPTGPPDETNTASEGKEGHEEEEKGGGGGGVGPGGSGSFERGVEGEPSSNQEKKEEEAVDLEGSTDNSFELKEEAPGHRQAEEEEKGGGRGLFVIKASSEGRDFGQEGNGERTNTSVVATCDKENTDKEEEEKEEDEGRERRRTALERASWEGDGTEEAWYREKVGGGEGTVGKADVGKSGELKKTGEEEEEEGNEGDQEKAGDSEDRGEDSSLLAREDDEKVLARDASISGQDGEEEEKEKKDRQEVWLGVEQREGETCHGMEQQQQINRSSVVEEQGKEEKEDSFQENGKEEEENASGVAAVLVPVAVAGVVPLQDSNPGCRGVGPKTKSVLSKSGTPSTLSPNTREEQEKEENFLPDCNRLMSLNEETSPSPCQSSVV